MTRTAITIGLMLLAGEAHANTPVPPGCIALAVREGFPTDSLTRLQLARARVRMARLSKSDPLVVQCRSAIEAARAEARSHGTE